MKTRPTSVTVIAWFLVVTSALSVISLLRSGSNPRVQEFMSKSAVSVPVQCAMSYILIAGSIISGIAMLKGCNWGRNLYVGLTLVGFVFGFATSPIRTMLIPGLVVFVAVCILLYRPAATQYFLSTETPDDA